MEKLFDSEGPVIGFLEKCGQLIVSSVLWLLGCVPVVTAAASTAALYDAVVLAVRKQQGSAHRIFADSFRRNLLRGTALTVIFLLAAALLEAASLYLFHTPYPTGIAGVLMILCFFTMTFAAPVLAISKLGILAICRLSFVISVQYAHYTLLVVLGTAALVLLMLFVLPMGLILILPGVWCWCCSFLLEKAMKRYFPQESDDR